MVDIFDDDDDELEDEDEYLIHCGRCGEEVEEEELIGCLSCDDECCPYCSSHGLCDDCINAEFENAEEPEEQP